VIHDSKVRLKHGTQIVSTFLLSTRGARKSIVVGRSFEIATCVVVEGCESGIDVAVSEIDGRFVLYRGRLWRSCNLREFLFHQFLARSFP
jgi:hypothetical protein